MSIIAEAAATQIPSGTWSIEGGDEPAIEGTVDATSITTFDGTRDGHLQSPDFFDTARYPEVRFASTEVSFDGGELRVQGDLTIKGTTKPVELKGTLLGSGPDMAGNERIGAELEGKLDRTDLGLN